MKRPLFCVTVAYALGAFTYLYTADMEKTGIVFAMLCLCAFFYSKKHVISTISLGLALLLGGVRAYVCMQEYSRQSQTAKAIEAASQEITMEGCLVDCDGQNYILQVDRLKMDRTLKFGNKVLLRGCEEMYPLGTKVVVSGRLQRFEERTNPGEFSQRRYYAARGMVAYMYQPEMMDLQSATWTIERVFATGRQKLYRLRGKFAQLLEQCAPAQQAGILKGILCGDKTELSPETKLLYQNSGIAHILAISGLHISLVGGGIYTLLRMFGAGFCLSGGCAMVLVFLYGVMTGMKLATIRAIWMFVLLIYARIRGRRYDVRTAMGLALACMVTVQPLRLFDGGMQLSYAAIAGVAVMEQIRIRLARRRSYVLFAKRHRFIRVLLESVMSSFCMSLVLMPVIAMIYYVLPVYSTFLNLLVLPLMTVVVACAWVGIFAGMISIGIGRLCLLPSVYCLRLFEGMCEVANRLPGHRICTGSVSAWTLIAYYLGILALLYIWDDKNRKKQKQFAIVASCIVIGFEAVILPICQRDHKAEQIVFLDVGQGDGCLIRTADGYNLVLDGGSSSKNQMGSRILIPALKSQKMATVDYWFLSHMDADHISGLEEILELGDLSQIRIKHIVVSEKLMRDSEWEQLKKQAIKQHISILYMDRYERLQGKSFSMTCYHPGADYQSEDKNANSLALLYQSDNQSVLFTGDMDTEALSYMAEHTDVLETWKQNKKSILKVAHHGSRDSLLQTLYVGCDEAVISCGRNNRYGHPHNETIERLEAAGSRILRTDELGAIMLSISPSGKLEGKWYR